MNPAAVTALRRIVMVVPTRLDIQLADSAITIVYSGDPDPYFMPFGKELKRDLGGELKLTAKAKWDGGWIVVNRSVGGGGSLTELLIPSANAERLTVVLELGQGGREGMRIRRVYDRRQAPVP
ncbi:MAG TPA: hypothetical protein VLH75_13290 [Longimicrobiales bacterium]|nr:hypothetical protein [Longimicrobiales bacterium]